MFIIMKPEDLSPTGVTEGRGVGTGLYPPPLPVAGARTKGAGDELGRARGPKNSYDQFSNTDSEEHMPACTSIRVFMTACPSEQH
jgi:hypothetical protein